VRWAEQPAVRCLEMSHGGTEARGPLPLISWQEDALLWYSVFPVAPCGPEKTCGCYYTLH